MLTDWRGTPIRAGSIVVYPGRTGSSLWMNEGYVVEFKDGKIGVRWMRSTGWMNTYRKRSERVSYPDPKRITVVC